MREHLALKIAAAIGGLIALAITGYSIGRSVPAGPVSGGGWDTMLSVVAVLLVIAAIAAMIAVVVRNRPARR